MAKKGYLMSEEEFENTNWDEVFDNFSKISEKEKEKVNKQTLKGLERLVK